MIGPNKYDMLGGDRKRDLYIHYWKWALILEHYAAVVIAFIAFHNELKRLNLDLRLEGSRLRVAPHPLPIVPDKELLRLGEAAFRVLFDRFVKLFIRVRRPSLVCGGCGRGGNAAVIRI